jgi:endonuclease V-like protein UPF0215 family
MTDNKRKKKTYNMCEHRFPVIIRDRSHFTSIISALNNSCGSGMENWTMTKKVGKHLRLKNSDVNTDVLIFNKSINTVELETFVKLL